MFGNLRERVVSTFQRVVRGETSGDKLRPAVSDDYSSYIEACLASYRQCLERLERELISNGQGQGLKTALRSYVKIFKMIPDAQRFEIIPVYFEVLHERYKNLQEGSALSDEQSIYFCFNNRLIALLPVEGREEFLERQLQILRDISAPGRAMLMSYLQAVPVSERLNYAAYFAEKGWLSEPAGVRRDILSAPQP